MRNAAQQQMAIHCTLPRGRASALRDRAWRACGLPSFRHTQALAPHLTAARSLS